MKRIVIIAIAIVCMQMVYAQNRQVKPFEVEFSAGVTVPFCGYHGGDAKFDVGSLGLDMRYNLANSPWDCGLFMKLDCAFRKFPQYDGGEQNNRTLSLGILGDYNFRQGRKVNPFVGLGVGVGFHDVVGGRYFPSKDTSMVFIPKVGVELLYFLRINAYAQLSRKEYNTFGMTFGVTLGGWPKKNR